MDSPPGLDPIRGGKRHEQAQESENGTEKARPKQPFHSLCLFRHAGRHLGMCRLTVFTLPEDGLV